MHRSPALISCLSVTVAQLVVVAAVDLLLQPRHLAAAMIHSASVVAWQYDGRPWRNCSTFEYYVAKSQHNCILDGLCANTLMTTMA